MELIQELHEMRAEMQEIDAKLVDVLARRQALASTILKWKHKNKCPLHAPELEWKIIERAVKMARNKGMEDEDYIRSLYYMILTHPFKRYHIQ